MGDFHDGTIRMLEAPASAQPALLVLELLPVDHLLRTRRSLVDMRLSVTGATAVPVGIGANGPHPCRFTVSLILPGPTRLSNRFKTDMLSLLVVKARGGGPSYTAPRRPSLGGHSLASPPFQHISWPLEWDVVIDLARLLGWRIVVVFIHCGVTIGAEL